jgi:hypothetical protein
VERAPFSMDMPQCPSHLLPTSSSGPQAGQKSNGMEYQNLRVGALLTVVGDRKTSSPGTVAILKTG